MSTENNNNDKNDNRPRQRHAKYDREFFVVVIIKLLVSDLYMASKISNHNSKKITHANDNYNKDSMLP